jgi:hypothetical protein
MTANEMADELELKVDRMSSNGSPGYEDIDITSVLTEAEHLYVKKFIDRKNNRKGESFEETEIRNQGLSALIKRGAGLSASASQTDVITNGKFYDLPSDFMYTIYESATLDKQVCGSETYIVAEVETRAHGEIDRLKDNKYKKPYYNTNGKAKVWRLVYSRENDGHDNIANRTDKRHQLVTDGTFTVTGYDISYLKFPDGIIVDRDTVANQRNSILDDSTHMAILDIAADLLMNRGKEQKAQNIESCKDVE